jgi:hypothetical protein
MIDIAEILLKVELNTKIQIHSRITHLRSYLTGKFYMLANILYFTISIWYVLSMEKIYIIIHFTLCFFVDLENFGHDKEAEEEMEEEEKADAAVDDATLEDVVEFTEDTGPRSGTLMKFNQHDYQYIQSCLLTL